MPLPNDVFEAKRMISVRLLSAGAERGVVGRSHMLSVIAASAAAGNNVHAVGVGHKMVDGQLTDEPCVRLYVVQKLAESLLSNNDLLPSTVDGIATDVIEAAPAFLLTAAPCTAARRSRQRPVMAGISGAHFRVTAGTISCFCRSTDAEDGEETIFVLSNNHVFGDTNRGLAGDDLFQASPADGGTNVDRIATLHRFVPIALGGQIPNRVDAAIGKMLVGVMTDSQICTIGQINGAGVAEENMPVCKHGRTTGYTEGTVFDPSVDALVGMDHSNPSVIALFQNQIRINVAAPFSAFGLGGDSGSLVLNRETHEAVALYNAGPAGGEYGLANRIEDVLAEMRIKLL